MEGDSGSSSVIISQPPEKKRQGRRKVVMKKIEKKESLNVTFSKRRKGLFKKAQHLCKLCNAKMAILVLSPVGKPYAWRYPSHGSVIDRFLRENSSNRNNYDESVHDVKEEEEREDEREEFRWDRTANKPEDSSMELLSKVTGLLHNEIQMVDEEETRRSEACTQDLLSGIGG